MGMANTSAQSFKNLPDTPSVPAASLTLHAFRRFELYLIEVFGNLVNYDSIQTDHYNSFYSLNVKFLIFGRELLH